MYHLLVEQKEEIYSIIDYLISKYSLPQIHRRLNIFSQDDNMQVEIVDNEIFFSDSSRKKYNFVKNKNLKEFFKFIESKNKNGFVINDIVILRFKEIDLLFDTFHGDLLSTENKDLAEELKKMFKLNIYENINLHDEKFTIKPEKLFDEMGNLNIKIKSYGYQTGLDIRSTSSSIRLRLSSISNDYSHVEKYYKLITGNELLSFKSNNKFSKEFKNMSIIIPTYNTNTIPTLLSIEGQHLLKKEKKMIQVIVIDDGSSVSVREEINKIKDKFDYELTIISFDKNMGLSNARNAGISLAKYDLLLFIDSDIILSKDYLHDMNIRMQIIPNAIFVSMRKNIDKSSKILNEEYLLKGVKSTLKFDDSRVITKSKKYHIGWDKNFKGEDISIIDDTNYFKQLSFGCKIGIYDLSTVVTGHNMAINKSRIKKYPVFSTNFKGWGMEDSYFASSLISNGCFVIPVLSSCVYHIDHEPRSGSMENKIKEAEENFKKYNDMLDEEWM